MKTLPADPIHPVDNRFTLCSGLTKREYFAAVIFASVETNTGGTYDNWAKNAVEAADALIAALNAPPK